MPGPLASNVNLHAAFWDGVNCTEFKLEFARLLGWVRAGERECPWLPVFDESTLPATTLYTALTEDLARKKLEVLRAWVEHVRAIVAGVNLRAAMSAATTGTCDAS